MARKHGSFGPAFKWEVRARGRSLTSEAQSVTIAAMSLIRGAFWLALFAFFTFCFIVLFEYGTADFSTGFKKESERVKSFVMQASKPAADKNKK
jgi:hypothetical protein